MSIVDASWIDSKDVGHYIHGSKYYNDKDQVEQHIHKAFPGIGFSSVDAALPGLGSREGKIYFFSGELYTRFDIKKGKCENGYPSSIKDVWRIPFSQIDAAWSHPSIKNKYYMSRGNGYIRLTVDKGGFDQGYPAKISHNWRGIDFNHIGAAIRGAGSRSGKMYFFSGAQYVRYDMKNDRVDSRYPKSIIGIWGFPNSWKPETKRVQVRLIDITCHETEDTFSEDEPTVNWSGDFGNQIKSGEWRITGLNDGERKNFPTDKQIIFDGDLLENDRIRLIVSLWERDNKGGNPYKKITEEAVRLLKEAGDIGKEIAEVAKDIGLDNIFGRLADLDGNDYLGRNIIDENIMTLPRGVKDYKFRFREDDANYTIRLRTEVT